MWCYVVLNGLKTKSSLLKLLRVFEDLTGCPLINSCHRENMGLCLFAIRLEVIFKTWLFLYPYVISSNVLKEISWSQQLNWLKAKNIKLLVIWMENNCSFALLPLLFLMHFLILYRPVILSKCLIKSFTLQQIRVF